MKIWKFISGILSIILSAFIFYQSRFAQLADILSGGGNAGTAGVVVAITILAGGILSLFVKKGSIGGNLAITVVYGIAAICGFSFSGDFPDLGIYAIWCLICAFFALIDLAVNRRDTDDDYEESPAPVPAAPRKNASIPLKTVMMEKNPARRNAMIDVLPEKEAKNYLKKAMDVLVNRVSLQSDDDDDILKTVLNVFLGIVGFIIIGVALFLALTNIFNRPQNSGTPSKSEPSASSTPAGPSKNTPEDQSTEGSDATPQGGSQPLAGELGEYHVEIKGAELISDYEGNPAIVITYSWTNNSDQTRNSLSAVQAKAFQDGIQLDSAIVGDSNKFDSSSYMREVRPGSTLDVQNAFLLTSDASVIEIEISQLISFSDDVVTASFDPAGL